MNEKEQQTRRDAISWWDGLSSASKTQLCDTNTEMLHGIRRWETLTGREIHQLWEEQLKKSI